MAALGAPETDEEWDDPFEVSDDPVFEEPTEPDAAEPDDDELPPELGFG